MTKTVKLYGSERCHKSQYYKSFLTNREIDFLFLDVKMNDDYAEELRQLYENRRLNFPTLTIGTKKLRNPSDKELTKWLEKLK